MDLLKMAISYIEFLQERLVDSIKPAEEGIAPAAAPVEDAEVPYAKYKHRKKRGKQTRDNPPGRKNKKPVAPPSAVPNVPTPSVAEDAPFPMLPPLWQPYPFPFPIPTMSDVFYPSGLPMPQTPQVSEPHPDPLPVPMLTSISMSMPSTMSLTTSLPTLPPIQLPSLQPTYFGNTFNNIEEL
ncbi:unnamed protein product, partial [Mesorhabditis spiculigera]